MCRRRHRCWCRIDGPARTLPGDVQPLKRFPASPESHRRRKSQTPGCPLALQRGSVGPRSPAQHWAALSHVWQSTLLKPSGTPFQKGTDHCASLTPSTLCDESVKIQVGEYTEQRPRVGPGEGVGEGALPQALGAVHQVRHKAAEVRPLRPDLAAPDCCSNTLFRFLN